MFTMKVFQGFHSLAQYICNGGLLQWAIFKLYKNRASVRTLVNKAGVTHFCTCGDRGQHKILCWSFEWCSRTDAVHLMNEKACTGRNNTVTLHVLCAGSAA